MEKPQFVNNEFYHIYNRGVEKRDVFLDNKDYFRFIHDLFEFNDEALALNLGYHLTRQTRRTRRKTIGVQLQYIEKREPRKPLVNILTFSQMPNHYHLILSQKKDNGIVRFMQKLGTGYTNYFNIRQERVGPLFQGRFRAVHINREEHLQYLVYYIHFNCLDLIEPDWRQGKIQDYQKAIKFLNSYRWSGHLDYIGKKNFPSVTQREFLLDIFGGAENYQKKIKKWLQEISKIRDRDTNEFKAVVLE